MSAQARPEARRSLLVRSGCDGVPCPREVVALQCSVFLASAHRGGMTVQHSARSLQDVAAEAVELCARAQDVSGACDSQYEALSNSQASVRTALACAQPREAWNALCMLWPTYQAEQATVLEAGTEARSTPRWTRFGLLHEMCSVCAATSAEAGASKQSHLLRAQLACDRARVCSRPVLCKALLGVESTRRRPAKATQHRPLSFRTWQISCRWPPPPDTGRTPSKPQTRHHSCNLQRTPRSRFISESP